MPTSRCLDRGFIEKAHLALVACGVTAALAGWGCQPSQNHADGSSETTKDSSAGKADCSLPAPVVLDRCGYYSCENGS
jgi:hypothetical protein